MGCFRNTLTQEYLRVPFLIMEKKLYSLLKDKYQNRSIELFLNEIISSEIVNYVLKKKDYFYRSFYINKKNGSKRLINEPLHQLHSIQKEIATFLLFNRYSIKNSHGFELNKSIVSNAANHINKKIVLNIDLEDFFPSITKNKVINLLTKKFKLNEKEAETVAEILTFKNILPQGAPSSPIISNYVCEKLDKDLHKFCKSFNIVYTRYADDLTFSFAFNKLPKLLVKEIYSIIEKNEFKINNKKTRYFYRNRRQVVTGLVVNEKVNVKKDFQKRIRAILHNWKTKGFKNVTDTFLMKYGNNKEFMPTVSGWINFYGQVKGFNDEAYLKFKNEFDSLANKEKYVKTFFIKAEDTFTIEELKSLINIPVFHLNTIVDKNGNRINFKKHWDKKRRIAVVIHNDLINKLKRNEDLKINIVETVKIGKDGDYLMLFVKDIF
jgi:RNA-directed DNA polymerase